MRRWPLPQPDVYKRQPMLCANFFGHPADAMKMIGVTGTNGKTTSVFLIKHLLAAAGHRTGLVLSLIHI